MIHNSNQVFNERPNLEDYNYQTTVNRTPCIEREYQFKFSDPLIKVLGEVSNSHTQKELQRYTSIYRFTLYNGARGAKSDLLEHNECSGDSTVSAINPNNGSGAVSNFRKIAVEKKRANGYKMKYIEIIRF